MVLRRFVDFAFSLANMEEVRADKNPFPLPKEVVFKLPLQEYKEVYLDVLKQKGENPFGAEILAKFEVELYNINFIFEVDE